MSKAPAKTDKDAAKAGTERAVAQARGFSGAMNVIGGAGLAGVVLIRWALLPWLPQKFAYVPLALAVTVFGLVEWRLGVANFCGRGRPVLRRLEPKLFWFLVGFELLATPTAILYSLR